MLSIFLGKGMLSRLIPTCGLRRRLGSVLGFRKIFRTMTASQGILLFYSHLPNKKLVLYPNKDSLICSPCFSKDNIGKDVVKAAKDLVLKLNRESDLEDAIESIQKKQENLEKKMDLVLQSLHNLTNSLNRK